MSNINIQNINSLEADGLYHQVGSIKRLQLTDIANIGLDFNPAVSAQVYDISFRAYTCKHSEVDRKTRAGTIINQKIEAFIPRRRWSVELMRRKLRDKRIAAIATDFHDNKYVLQGRIFVNFSTGIRPGESNGYSLVIEGSSTGRNYVLSFGEYVIYNQEGYSGGADFSQETVAVDPPVYAAGDCCVTIQQTPVAVAPSPTGNVVNLNKMVTTAQGEKYFIDKDGNSIMLSNDMIKEVIPGNDTDWTYPLSTIVDNTRLFALRQNMSLLQTDTPIDIGHYNVDASQLILPEAWPLEASETVTLIRI